MEEQFKRTTASIICSSIIAFIIGLILVIWPGLSLEVIGIIVGIYIIIHGLVMLVLDFKASKYFVPFDGIIIGILSIILGIILIAFPNVLSTILGLVLGVWIILSSVNIIKMAVAVKKFYSGWGLLLVFGILDLIAGGIILFNPFLSSVSLTMIAGIVIMVHSVISVVDMIIIKKDIKDIEKAIEKASKRPTN